MVVGISFISMEGELIMGFNDWLRYTMNMELEEFYNLPFSEQIRVEWMYDAEYGI